MKKTYTILMLFLFLTMANAQNLALNGDFQSWVNDSVPTIWSGEAGTKLLAEPTIVHSADSSMHVELLTSTQSQTDFRQSINVIAGHTYHFSVWVYNLDTLSYITLFAGEWTNVESDYMINDVWQEITYDYTPTVDGSIEIGLRFYDAPGFDATTAHSFMYIDDYSVIDMSISVTAPVIDNVVTIPSIPTSNDNVDIQADITDDGTIVAAYLLWGTDGVTFADSIPMSLVSGDTYQTDTPIPAQLGGTTVYYYVGAVDNDDEIGESPVFNYILLMGVPTGDCENLFFSEYIEGTSFNKALEIYNPTSDDIDLSNYSIERYNNGSSTPSTTMSLTGIITAGNVYVLGNTTADSVILSVSDTITDFISHNGNDVYVLYNYIDTLDIFGVIGSSTDIIVDSVTAVNHTLVRKIDIHKGQKDWSLGNMEWNIYDVDSFAFLGTHIMNECLVSVQSIQEKQNNLYPNPAVNTINFDNLDNIDVIEIVDAIGNIVSSVDVNSNTASINIACLKSGFYIARLKSGTEIKSIKFIKK